MFENIFMLVFKIGCALLLGGLVIMAICGAIAVAVEVFS